MKQANTVLVVDDSVINRTMICKTLSASYDTMQAADGSVALQMLRKHSNEIAAVLLDIHMPVMDGYAFLQAIQNTPLSTIPVIVMTGENDVGTEKRALTEGAWDFVAKPYDVDVLHARLRNAIGRSRLSGYEKMRILAQHDQLTGLYNRSRMFEETHQMLIEHPDERFLFVRFDINHFKMINTYYGEEEGDRLLLAIAGHLREVAERYSLYTFGRLEADVFAVCLPYSGRAATEKAILAQRDWLHSYPLDFDIVPSFGLYIIQDNEEPLNDICAKTILAQHGCKGNYIQDYAYYTEEMTENVMREQRITNNMSAALQNNEFVLYVQPKYDLRTSQMHGGEVLVRWKTEDGMVSPGEFIPVFETNGFITKLDYYVWEKSCRMIRGWLDAGYDPQPVSVNISRVSLYSTKLADTITHLVQQYNIPPRLLQLELTESAYTTNAATIKETMRLLQNNGFTILMDDFGSGYSSLNVLKDITLDVLKIDMKFMEKSDQPGRGENILASVVRMAKWLGMPVIAEGVETEAQVNFLRNIGCEYVQGFYFARPMPAAEYEKLAFTAQPAANNSADERTAADTMWTDTVQMEQMLSSMNQPVAVLVQNGDSVQVLRANQVYYDMFGYGDVNDLNGGYLRDILPKYIDMVKQAIRRAVEENTVEECEFERRAGTRTSWVRARLKNSGHVGTENVLFAMMDDITSQKELDEQVRRFRQMLYVAKRGQETVLVVDDEQVNRAVLQAIFEDKYRVLAAANGEEALQCLKAESYHVDVILLDLQMPVMDGITFLEHLRALQGGEEIPVVVTTVDGTVEQQKKLILLGAMDYAVKPFVPEVVSRRVENILESRRNLANMLQNYSELSNKGSADADANAEKKPADE